jgi:lysophospholipase L1-like esterase
VTFKRFAALGDSLTEGVGDPAWFGLRGWADRLAAQIALTDPDFSYLNLARRSLRTAEVIEQQLGTALKFESDLAGAVVGMNDLLNPDFDPEGFAEDLRYLVIPLQDAGATVLMASFPDVSRGLPLLSSDRRLSLHNRLKSAGDVVRSVASELDAVFVDGWEMSRDGMPGVMSIDRLHPNARGHALIAAAFAEQLSIRTGFQVEVPEHGGSRLTGGLESALHLRWLAVNTIAPALWRAARARLRSRASFSSQKST